MQAQSLPLEALRAAGALRLRVCVVRALGHCCTVQVLLLWFLLSVSIGCSTGASLRHLLRIFINAHVNCPNDLNLNNLLIFLCGFFFSFRVHIWDSAQ